MDSFEAAKVVHDRILKLEPENIAKKIIGYIYLQSLPNQEMIRLALSPDIVIQTLIQKVKNTLQGNVISPPISPNMNPNPLSDSPINHFNPFSPSSHKSAPYRVSQYWDPHIEEFSTQFNMDDDFYSSEAAFNSMGIRGTRSNSMDYPVKICHYFSKGFCKHGSNCRYYHGETFPEIFNYGGLNSYDGDDHVFLPGSLEKLEIEIAELLKSRRGNPVSIASLPMMYYENYGKTLQAEGYLTESQRHGKAGYSLTKLLARLKNSIRLIDRPHGQHAVILAEDAPKYMDIRVDRNDPGQIVCGSRQIYLTFPAESTFTEDDVSNYFSTFGPVQDVRIPCQQKRMFGFVTFLSSDTVKLILSKGNPHHVCGARVLVKPYREKSKLIERKYEDKFDHPMYSHSLPVDMDLEIQARWESSRIFRKQIMEEHMHALELETMRLSQLQLARKSMPGGQSYLGYSTDEPKAQGDNPVFPSTECYNYLLDVLNNGSTSDDNSKHSINNCSDKNSAQGLSLPDSPFASTGSVSAEVN